MPKVNQRNCFGSSVSTIIQRPLNNSHSFRTPVFHFHLPPHSSPVNYNRHRQHPQSPNHRHPKMPEDRAVSLAAADDQEEEEVFCSPYESPFDSDPESEPRRPEPLPPSAEEQKILIQSTQKALMELRCKVEDAIRGNYIFGARTNPRKIQNLEDQDITLWGVPLLPTKNHEGTDVVLTNFLKAKDFNVPEAFSMLCKVLKWRRDFRVDEILEEKMSPEFESMWKISGVDKDGRPVCFLSFRELKNRDMRKKLFREDGKLEEFLRWRIQCIERVIPEMEFKPGGVTSFLQITDLKNAPSQSVKELRWLCRKLMGLVREYYPGLVYKIFIVNVPLWVFAMSAINLRHVSARSKNLVIFVRSALVKRTLLKYVNPDNLLALYGGLKRECDREFSSQDKVLELNVRANAVEHIRIPANEVEVKVIWDVAVVGNEVIYKAEFIPVDDCSYTVLLEKEKKMGNGVRGSFYIREPGHILLSFVNPTFKRKNVFYRYTSQPCVPMYMLSK